MEEDDGARGQRPRRKTTRSRALRVHPIGTPTRGFTTNTGPLASAAWLSSCGLVPATPRWRVEIEVGTDDAPPTTVLRVEIFSEEWGYQFHHEGRRSWIRVTDIPFVHGHDDHGLLAITPALKHVARLARALEARFGFRFALHRAAIETDVEDAEPAIRAWLSTW